jgi:hypothetical protein
VEAFVGLLQVFAGDVRVDLGRGNVRVAEHLLDGADVGVILDQMRRKRMPQRMRRNPRKPAFFGVFLDKGVNYLSGQRLAVRRDETVVDVNILVLSS